MTIPQPSVFLAVKDFVAALECRPDGGRSDLDRSAKVVQGVRPGAFVYPEVLPDALRSMAGGREYRKSCELVLDIVQQYPKEPVLNRLQAAIYVGYYNLPKSGSHADGDLPRDVAVSNRAAETVARILDASSEKIDPKWRMTGEMLIARTFEDKTPRGRQAQSHIKLLLRTAGRQIGAGTSELAASFLDDRKKAPGAPVRVPVPQATVGMSVVASPPRPVQPVRLANVIPFPSNRQTGTGQHYPG